jgi:digeranylgeranylglycerophospholipid reductase
VQDAVVVGGGPAGSSVAYALAKRGAAVTIFEEHPEVGHPSHCAGHLSIRSLRTLGLYSLPKGIVENVFSAANFYSPRGTKFSVHLDQPVTCSVNRPAFDKFLADKAVAAGAKLELSHRVQSLLAKNGYINGVQVTSGQNTEKEDFSANLVVDAEGISSRLIRQAGLQTLNPKGLVFAVEADVETVSDVEDHSVEVYFGKDFAPGFYAWLIPRLDGTAKVGLATENGNPKEFFQRLIRKHPVASKQLRKANIKKMAFHTITLGGPIPRPYTSGFLAVGDCASQVKPTTGGGVILGITCAKIAAETAFESMEKNDFADEILHSYQKKCQDLLGFDLRVMLKARKAANSFSDEEIERALRFASKVGFDRALHDINEIDFQGQTLLRVLRKPSAYATLAYLIALHLPANA